MTSGLHSLALGWGCLFHLGTARYSNGWHLDSFCRCSDAGPSDFWDLEQSLGGHAKLVMESPNHGEVKISCPVENLRNTARTTEIVGQLAFGDLFLIQHELERLYRVWRLDRMVFALVAVNEDRQDLCLRGLWRAGLGIQEFLESADRACVVIIAVDWADLHSSNLLCINAIVFGMRSNEPHKYAVPIESDLHNKSVIVASDFEHVPIVSQHLHGSKMPNHIGRIYPFRGFNLSGPLSQRAFRARVLLPVDPKSTSRDESQSRVNTSTYFPKWEYRETRFGKLLKRASGVNVGRPESEEGQHA